MNYDALIEDLSCKLGHNSYHLLNNPKKLPCCGRNGCDSCILKICGQYGNVFKCVFCGETSTIKIIDGECVLKQSMQIVKDLEKYTVDINHYLMRRLENSIDRVEERFESNEEYLKKRQVFIEEEIHSQVKALKAQLDDYEERMKNELRESCQNANSNIKAYNLSNQSVLNEIKHSSELLKSKAFSYAADLKVDEKNELSKEEMFLKTAPQRNSINQIFSHIFSLNQMNDKISSNIEAIKFYPNIEPINHEFIGILKCVKEKNLENNFKEVIGQWEISGVKSIKNSNKKIPVSPHCICLLNTDNALFTDAHKKQVIQINLTTGDYVRSSNLNGMLKNPDGICINHNKGIIYIVDSDLGSIFKLDLNFNVLKQFGSKDLKLPRGIYYDSQTSSANRLYVCDYLNERVAIYNDQDQLRDELYLRASDKSIPSHNTVGKYDSSEIEDEFKFSPRSLKITAMHVYVADDWNSSNCIRVFDKITKKLIRNIGNLQAWNPTGIAVDANENVFTLARLYYETGIPYLFCFSKKGELLYKTNLDINDNGTINDFIFDKYSDQSHYSMIACGESRLYVVKFK